MGARRTGLVPPGPGRREPADSPRHPDPEDTANDTDEPSPGDLPPLGRNSPLRAAQDSGVLVGAGETDHEIAVVGRTATEPRQHVAFLSEHAPSGVTSSALPDTSRPAQPYGKTIGTRRPSSTRSKASDGPSRTSRTGSSPASGQTCGTNGSRHVGGFVRRASRVAPSGSGAGRAAHPALRGRAEEQRLHHQRSELSSATMSQARPSRVSRKGERRARCCPLHPAPSERLGYLR